MSFSLKEGELLPSSSIIKIETPSKKYEFLLNDLVNEQTISGNYYIEGKPISGNGEGYGIKGTAEIPQEVTFTLDIITESASETTKESEEKQTDELEEITNETTTAENSNETSAEEPSVEEAEETTTESTETTNEETNTETSETTITGNVISRFFKGISNFFLGIARTQTGKVTLKVDNNIEAKVSKDTPYTYTLNEGQTASLNKGSVKVNDKKVDDDKISININDNVVTVTTNYAEEKEGFGEEYINNEITKEIDIDLKKLDIDAEKGNLKISLIYNNEEIVSASSSLEVEGETVIAKNITEKELEKSNKTKEETNKTKNEVPVTLSLELTEQEKEILLENFKNLTIQTTKAEIVNNRLVLKYQLSKYWIEYSYDYNGNINNSENLMNRDKIKWLKDLSKQLSKPKSKTQKVESLIKEFNLTDVLNTKFSEINKKINKSQSSGDEESTEINNKTKEETNITISSSNTTIEINQTEEANTTAENTNITNEVANNI